MHQYVPGCRSAGLGRVLAIFFLNFGQYCVCSVGVRVCVLQMLPHKARSPFLGSFPATALLGDMRHPTSISARPSRLFVLTLHFTPLYRAPVVSAELLPELTQAHLSCL